MRKLNWLAPIVAIFLAVGLVGCSANDSDTNVSVPPPPPPPPPPPGDTYALTVSNKIISFNRATPGTVITNVAVTGLQANENLLGIDVRPSNGMLYGLGSTGRIYTLNVATGAATMVSTLKAGTVNMVLDTFTALNGTDFGVDFNPVPDRLRVISNTGQNLRINVDSGDVATDTPINGGAAGTAVTAVAYTDAIAGAATTTLYDIDTGADLLYVQNPPNNGLLVSPVTLGVDATAANGFDIDPRNQTGYAVLTVGTTTGLYTINLAATSNAATLVGAIGVSEGIRGLSLAPITPIIFAVTSGNGLISFNPATPNTVTTIAASITGLMPGENVVGIDVRPQDNMIYAVTQMGRVYTLNTTGAATLVAPLTADPNDTTAPFTTLTGTIFSVDFNPQANRLRTISNTGLNLRTNLVATTASGNTMATPVGSTITDGTINTTVMPPAMITGAAYTNNFAGTASTILYDINAVTSTLVMQVPPNDGTLVTVGPLGLTPMGVTPFDIVGGGNGFVRAAMRTTSSGPFTLYRIALSGASAGAATLATGDAATSQIGGAMGPSIVGMAIMLR